MIRRKSQYGQFVGGSRNPQSSVIRAELAAPEEDIRQRMEQRYGRRRQGEYGQQNQHKLRASNPEIEVETRRVSNEQRQRGYQPLKSYYSSGNLHQNRQIEQGLQRQRIPQHSAQAQSKGAPAQRRMGARVYSGQVAWQPRHGYRHGQGHRHFRLYY